MIMEKRVLVNLPADLYNGLKGLAKREYRSISSLIRESILDRMGESFTQDERALIEQGRKSFRGGKGKNWRTIKRG